jgi:hypothetical protein
VEINFIPASGIIGDIEDRTKRFYNNVNSKKLKCLEELVTAIAAITSSGQEERR